MGGIYVWTIKTWRHPEDWTALIAPYILLSGISTLTQWTFRLLCACGASLSEHGGQKSQSMRWLSLAGDNSGLLCSRNIKSKLFKCMRLTGRKRLSLTVKVQKNTKSCSSCGSTNIIRIFVPYSSATVTSPWSLWIWIASESYLSWGGGKFAHL